MKLYKYQVDITKIPYPGGRSPKKRETKRAVIKELMSSFLLTMPDLKWASDFDGVILRPWLRWESSVESLRMIGTGTPDST